MKLDLLPRLRPDDDHLSYALDLPADHALLADHHVRGHPVLPGVACFDAALSAMRLAFPGRPVRAFEDWAWLRPAVCDGATLRLRVMLREESADRVAFEMSGDDGVLARGSLASVPIAPEPWKAAAGIWRDVAETSTRRLNRRQVYAAFAGMGIDYGPHFRRIHYADIEANHAVALLSDNDAVRISLCGLLDCAFQSGMAISIGQETASLMPFSLGSLAWHMPIEDIASHSFYVVTEKASPYRTQIGIHDEDGVPVASVMDLGVKPSRL